MKRRLLKILDFVRLLDENGTLSLTNIAVIVVLVKLALDPALNYQAVAALLGVIGSYSFKRWTQRTERTSAIIPVSGADLEKVIEEIQDKVSKMELRAGFAENNR